LLRHPTRGASPARNSLTGGGLVGRLIRAVEQHAQPSRDDLTPITPDAQTITLRALG
jgi:hypothetical protein